MHDFAQSLIGQSEWNNFGHIWLSIGFKVALSILCGGAIGLERELKHKPAGLRTNILICLGSALFTLLSVMMASSAPGEPGDPTRVAAQIVSGIGFLGGGMILQSGGSVSGLTSAATVWVVAAIGMCIGLGYPITAAIFTVTVFVTLYFLSKVDRKIFGKMHCYETWIHLKSMDSNARAEIMETFQQGDLELTRLSVDERDDRYQILARYFSSEVRHLRIQAALWSVPAVDRIDVKMS
ncbi:MAG: MgtC/SapB family protein [Bdellovibrionota bacterium]